MMISSMVYGATVVVDLDSEREQNTASVSVSTSGPSSSSSRGPVLKIENSTSQAPIRNGAEGVNDDDGISVVVPEKFRVLSDMRAIVDYHELQMNSALRKIDELENKLKAEGSKTASLQTQVAELEDKIQGREKEMTDLTAKYELERSVAAFEAEGKQQEIGALKAKLEKMYTRTNLILNAAKRKMVEAQTFFTDVNELGKLFDGYYMVTDDIPTTSTTPMTQLVSSFTSAGPSASTSNSVSVPVQARSILAKKPVGPEKAQVSTDSRKKKRKSTVVSTERKAKQLQKFEAQLQKFIDDNETTNSETAVLKLQASSLIEQLKKDLNLNVTASNSNGGSNIAAKRRRHSE